jgi:hypothetical protein
MRAKRKNVRELTELAESSCCGAALAAIGRLPAKQPSYVMRGAAATSATSRCGTRSDDISQHLPVVCCRSKKPARPKDCKRLSDIRTPLANGVAASEMNAVRERPSSGDRSHMREMLKERLLKKYFAKPHSKVASRQTSLNPRHLLNRRPFP